MMPSRTIGYLLDKESHSHILAYRIRMICAYTIILNFHLCKGQVMISLVYLVHSLDLSAAWYRIKTIHNPQCSFTKESRVATRCGRHKEKPSRRPAEDVERTANKCQCISTSSNPPSPQSSFCTYSLYPNGRSTSYHNTYERYIY